MLRSIAVLYHPARERAVEEARWLSAELRRRGLDVALGDGWDDGVISETCLDRELVVALGGDGTIIHTARLAARYGTPVMGVNLGRVGFLAELTPAALHEKIDALVAGQFWIEDHTMLDVLYRTGDRTESFIALNEVVLARGGLPHAVHVTTALDGEGFLTYTADGVLVSTATGSTAYSLAAGGPILYPESRDMLITPIAPHLHIGRSMVVPADTVITLALASERVGAISIDGEDERKLREGDVVEVRRSPVVSHFARLNPRRYFYTAIADRLR